MWGGKSGERGRRRSRDLGWECGVPDQDRVRDWCGIGAGGGGIPCPGNIGGPGFIQGGHESVPGNNERGPRSGTDGTGGHRVGAGGERGQDPSGAGAISGGVVWEWG